MVSDEQRDPGASAVESTDRGDGLRLPDSLTQHPLHSTLSNAIENFEFGDYPSTLRALAPITSSSDAPAEFRAIADRLTAAMGLEPAAVAIAVVCSAVFASILWLVY